MPDSINSLSPDFRDALLNRNLISDTVTQNGLEGLLTGIGQPITNIGHQPESVQPSTDIQEDGVFYKDLHVTTNKFQGTDDDYRTANISYQSANINTNGAIIYTSDYVQKSGVLKDTLDVDPKGAFQGGDIRSFNTSRNLYDEPDKRYTVHLDDISAPNVKYSDYLTLNADIVSREIDVLGSIFTGRGVGIGASGNLVPHFDLRASLLGRVLGGSGVISDTPIGQAGAKYLALALANNAAFGLQQETIGNLNLNPLNIAMNGTDAIVVPNYDITVPKSTLGKVLDFGARVLGFEVPVSLFVNASSIFASLDGNFVSNIERGLSQIENTGKGQVLALFGNLKSNTDPRLIGRRSGYAPGYKNTRVQDQDQGINPNIYAFYESGGEGKVIDLLNNNVSVDFNQNNSSEPDEFDPNSPMSQSNYRLEGLIDNSGFDESPSNFNAYGQDNSTTKFSWGDAKNNKASREVFGKDIFQEKKTILFKTQRLFNSNRMRTIVSGKAGGGDLRKSETQSSVQGGLISKGSGVLSQSALEGDFENADAVFCRTWSTFDKYNQVQDLQKNSGLHSNVRYRDGLDESVLDENGFVKIAPYVGDDDEDGGLGGNNIKNFMFSIENLAWADNHEKLLKCELGPGDQHGKRGRIMWFPPYDLNITENTSVNIDSTDFIGRGEPIYTYNNTQRTGTLQFKIVVDHPSYLNDIRQESDEYISSFFAGCTDINPAFSQKLTQEEKDTIELKNAQRDQKKEVNEINPDIPKVDFYFSNDNATLNSDYEDGDDNGLGTTVGEKIVSSVSASFVDQTDFGLNGDNNPAIGDLGGWITPQAQNKLKEVLNEQCQACKIKIAGFASSQGGTNNPLNEELSKRRAEAVKNWFINNILTTSKIPIEKRFGSVKGEGVTGCEDGEERRHDSECVKLARKVNVVIEHDADLQLILEDNENDVVETPEENATVNQNIKNRFYNECSYFQRLKQEDEFVYTSIREKLKFFHPAFHAITPEGLNSRLTFLHQCTRQGPTAIKNKPDNLAFGRPPVCILRVGDFYHTKIMLDNMNISYEPLVWDLNPEGIGVQPMIATVDLSFKMIGGQSLKGPINKLQNAVSFNFFGNSQVYDVRSDKLKKSGSEWTFVEGKKTMDELENPQDESQISNPTGSRNPKPDKNQIETNSKDMTEEQQIIKPEIKGISLRQLSITGLEDMYDVKVEVGLTAPMDNNTADELANKGVKVSIDGIDNTTIRHEKVVPSGSISSGGANTRSFLFNLLDIKLTSGDYKLTVLVGGKNKGTSIMTIE